jgi:outer membrane immunogenic protein
MKRFIALTAVVFASIALLRIAFAGPEPFSGKEMKQVAPAPLPECNWTGFYFGGLAGYAGGTLDWTDRPEPQEMDQSVTTQVDKDQSGFIGGGELGFNYQWHWLVLGAEGTFSYSDVQMHNAQDVADEANIYDTRSDWQGTIAGRLGFAWNKFLFYGKGGAAFVNQRYSWLHGDNESENTDVFKTNETRVGPLVGGGIEYMINCNWSAKLEYNHFFLGKDTISGTRIDDGSPEEESYDVDLSQDSLQVGLNYKFWSF